MAILPFIRQKTINCLKGVKKKGNFKKTLVYSFVFLFLLGIIAKIDVKSLEKEELSFLKASASCSFSPDLFAESIKNPCQDSGELIFLQENTLVRTNSTFSIRANTSGALTGDIEDELGRGKAIVEYIVESGETLSSIAAKFDISLNTLLWANDLTKSSKVRPGQKLVVPPVSGIIYYVKKGDTLGAVAKTYKGKVEEIIAFNELSDEGDIFIGDILVIPGGQMPAKTNTTYLAQPQIPIGSSYFICPHSACKITQGLHWYNAIDFGGKCGDPIYAAAGGTVLKVKYGWNQGSGNYLSILHPNGVVTTYGHISTSLVNPGQEVSQGQIIALMGGQPGTPGAGISTGCHVHFDVKGARNPFAR